MARHGVAGSQILPLASRPFFHFPEGITYAKPENTLLLPGASYSMPSLSRVMLCSPGVWDSVLAKKPPPFPLDSRNTSYILSLQLREIQGPPNYVNRQALASRRLQSWSLSLSGRQCHLGEPGPWERSSYQPPHHSSSYMRWTEGPESV